MREREWVIVRVLVAVFGKDLVELSEFVAVPVSVQSVTV